MKNFKGLLKNKKGQSEVVAVLVLVAVVIVGAIGVGVIMNGFSNQVASTASADGISDGAATELLVAGSTTVQPLSECLGKLYMTDNKGVRVTVQGGGSGAGVAATGMGVVDLGSSSRALNSAESTKYPTIQTHKIGGSAVVVIVSSGCAASTNATNPTELKNFFNNKTGTVAGITPTIAYQRSESSGTEETFAKYLGVASGTDSQLPTTYAATGASGNQGVLDAVKSTTACYVGFVDYGFTVDANGADISGIVRLNVTDASGNGNYPATKTNILNALKGDATAYPNSESNGLTRPLNYLTNGAPSVLAQKFIGFASAPGDLNSLSTAAHCFQTTGYFAAWQFA